MVHTLGEWHFEWILLLLGRHIRLNVPQTASDDVRMPCTWPSFLGTVGSEPLNVLRQHHRAATLDELGR